MRAPLYMPNGETEWRRGDSNPGPRQDRPQRLRAYFTDWGLQPLASEKPTSGQVF